MTSTLKVDNIQDTDGNNIINENANTITIGASGDTITIPSGATINNQGSSTGFASIQWQSSIKTGDFTAASGEGYWVDTSSGAVEVTLPTSPAVGDQLIFTDYARNFGTNNLTLDQGSNRFQGELASTAKAIYSTNGQSIDIVYSGATKGWIPNSDDDVTLAADPSYALDILVIAGGAGGGGQYYSGGGGAGGNRTITTQRFTPGTTYTVTVGNGGTGGGNVPDSRGGNGNDSSVSGSGFTTITSTGGGGGGAGGATPQKTGQDGGCGGGGSGYNDGGLGGGTGNTPATDPAQGFDGGGNNATPEGGGGGGGGSSAVGETPTSQNGGFGGDGSASTITGASVTRGGGGGGADSYITADGGAGGAGGGGKGANTSNDNTAGTANTGGGGGASRTSTGSAGGSGVVIFRILTTKYSGTVTGSPSVATDGSHKVITFTGDGSIDG